MRLKRRGRRREGGFDEGEGGSPDEDDGEEEEVSEGLLDMVGSGGRRGKKTDSFAERAEVLRSCGLRRDSSTASVDEADGLRSE